MGSCACCCRLLGCCHSCIIIVIVVIVVVVIAYRGTAAAAAAASGVPDLPHAILPAARNCGGRTKPPAELCHQVASFSAWGFATKTVRVYVCT